MSDHEALMFTLLIDAIDCVLHQPVRFNFKKANYTTISHTLNSVDWTCFQHDCVGVDDMWMKFLTYLKSLVKEYIPHKTDKKKRISKFIKKFYNLDWRLRNSGKGCVEYAHTCKMYKDAVL